MNAENAALSTRSRTGAGDAAFRCVLGFARVLLIPLPSPLVMKNLLTAVPYRTILHICGTFEYHRSGRMSREERYA
jgi:hypothetical protein